MGFGFGRYLRVVTWSLNIFPALNLGDRIRGTLGDIDPLNKVPC